MLKVYGEFRKPDNPVFKSIGYKQAKEFLEGDVKKTKKKKRKLEKKQN